MRSCMRCWSSWDGNHQLYTVVRTVDPKLFKNLTWQCFFCCLMRGEGFNEMPCSDWWRIFSYLPVLPIEIIFISCIVGTFKPRKRGPRFFRLPGFCKVLHGYHGQEVLIKRTPGRCINPMTSLASLANVWNLGAKGLTKRWVCMYMYIFF